SGLVIHALGDAPLVSAGERGFRGLQDHEVVVARAPWKDETRAYTLAVKAAAGPLVVDVQDDPLRCGNRAAPASGAYRLGGPIEREVRGIAVGAPEVEVAVVCVDVRVPRVIGVRYRGGERTAAREDAVLDQTGNATARIFVRRRDRIGGHAAVGLERRADVLVC